MIYGKLIHVPQYRSSLLLFYPLTMKAFIVRSSLNGKFLTFSITTLYSVLP